MQTVLIWIEYIATQISITAIIISFFWIIGKTYLRNEIEQSIKLKYQKELKLFQSMLKKEEAEDEFLRSSVLSSAVALQNGNIHNHKINAATTLWNFMLINKKYFWVIKFVATLNFDEFKKRPKEPNMEKFLNLFPDTQLIKQTLEEAGNPELSRLWLTPEAWALYSAYSVFLFYGVFQIDRLKIASNAKDFDSFEEIYDQKKMVELIRIIEPNSNANRLNSHELPKYLESIESKLIEELRRNVYGSEPSIYKEHTKNILQIVSDIRSENKIKENETQSNFHI